MKLMENHLIRLLVHALILYDSLGNTTLKESIRS